MDGLGEEGYSIDMASSGAEAIIKAKQTGYDVVITDLMMPGMSGMEVLDHFTENQPETLVVMLTGKAYAPDVQLEPPGLQTVVRETFTGEIASAAQLADRLRDVIAEIRRPNSYDLHVGRLTDVGHVRQLNEDSLLTLELGRVHRSLGMPIGLYVVADGMCGHGPSWTILEKGPESPERLELTLSSAERPFLDKIDGTRTLRDLVALGPGDIALNARILYAFWVLKLILRRELTSGIRKLQWQTGSGESRESGNGR